MHAVVFTKGIPMGLYANTEHHAVNIAFEELPCGH